jgi:(2R)-3-sulfolactate dehydrogenase (NADP+)
VVELLVTALTGSAIGFEATSFFVDEGNRPRLGQAFLVIDPAALAGRATYDERVETLLAAKRPTRACGCPASVVRGWRRSRCARASPSRHRCTLS